MPGSALIDFHAFAVVALDHRMLLELPMDDAYEIAAAAIRQADVAQRSPDSEFGPFCPRAVRARRRWCEPTHWRACHRTAPTRKPASPTG